MKNFYHIIRAFYVRGNSFAPSAENTWKPLVADLVDAVILV